MTTFETVRDMMVDQFKLDPSRITPDATLESLDIDSLSGVEFMFLLEEKFSVVFTDGANDANDKHTVQDLVEALDRLLAQRVADSAHAAAENTT